MRGSAVAAALCLLVACSGGDDLATPTSPPPPTATSSTLPLPPTPSGAAQAPAGTTPAPSTTSRATTTIVSVPETGVPGLDSDDAFCASWSRFGGTWQVLLVGSTFLGDPQRVAEWEVAASGVVAGAYDDLVESLPDRLSSEAELVADGFFGVLERRSAAAAEALADAGASTDDVARLGAAWLDALAARDPSSPDLALLVPDDLADVVAAAATALRAARVEFHLDPSMVVAVDTPLTDEYLETSCPDQGTLVGTEVDP